MPDHRLDGRSGEAPGRFTKRLLDRPSFDAVVQFRSRAVVSEVTDLRRRELGFPQGQRHRPRGLVARFVEPDAMVRVARGTVAANLAVDPGTPVRGSLVVLDDEHPGSLAEHEPIAVAGKRARGRLWIVVAARRDD